MLNIHKASADFYKDFKNLENVIDRKEENKIVDLYKQNKDDKLLENIFKKRIPTLKYWALKHYFPGLALSVEDFYGELIIVFMKAIEGYNIKRGNFNTCLYTYLLNRIKNIKNKKYAKKRIPINYEGPLSGILLSLDYQYGEDGNKKTTIKDIINNEISSDYEKNIDNANFEDYVNIFSDGDIRLKDIFSKLGDGYSVGTIMKECKTKNGEMILTDDIMKNINNTNIKNIIVEKIKNDTKIVNFKLIDYTIEENIIKYSIEVKKTLESELFSKAIRKIRKNKKMYIDKTKKENIDICSL